MARADPPEQGTKVAKVAPRGEVACEVRHVHHMPETLQTACDGYQTCKMMYYKKMKMSTKLIQLCFLV